MLFYKKPQIYIVEIGEIDTTGRNILGSAKVNSNYIGCKIVSGVNLNRDSELILEFFLKGDRIGYRDMIFKKGISSVQEATVGFPPDNKYWKAGTYSFILRDKLSGEIVSEKSFTIGIRGLAISIKSAGEEVSEGEYRDGLAKTTSTFIGGKITITPVPEKNLVLKIEILKDNIVLDNKNVEIKSDEYGDDIEFIELNNIKFSKPKNDWRSGKYKYIVINVIHGEIVDQYPFRVVDYSIFNFNPPIDKDKAINIAKTFVIWHYFKFYESERPVKVEERGNYWILWFQKKTEFKNNEKLGNYLFIEICKEDGKVKNIDKPYKSELFEGHNL